MPKIQARFPTRTSTTRGGLGDTVSGLSGILSGQFNEYRIHPIGTVVFASGGPRPATPATMPGRLHIASMNVLNFFTTLDTRLARLWSHRWAGLPRREQRGRVRPSAHEVVERAASAQRRHRGFDGNREQRERGGAKLGRWPEQPAGRGQLRVHQHRHDRHGRDQAGLDLQAGQGHASERAGHPDQRGQPVVRRHQESAFVGANVSPRSARVGGSR